MPSVRQAAVAGLFYPGDAGSLRRRLTDLLAGPPPAPDATPPKALIVPHAGYVYSGATAARAYRLLAPGRRRIRRVVLLGPSHRVALRGLAVPSAEAFATPLGRVPVDRAAIDRIAGLPGVQVCDAAHAEEHSLEVQLPFLQAVLDDFSVVPVTVGAGPAEWAANLVDALWGGPETLIVVSSDLSHYLDDERARAADARTRDRIIGHATTLTDREACGARAINGLMRSAAARALEVEAVDLRNSGDATGDRGRVVGYGSFALREAPAARPADGCGNAAKGTRGDYS